MFGIKAIQSLLACTWLYLGCLETAYSRVELVRKEPSEFKIWNGVAGNFTGLVNEQKRVYKPKFNYSEEFVPPNKTQELLNFYREMTTLKNSSVAPIRDAYIYGVLIPKTDAKVEKLRAETAYIETKNAAKKKRLKLAKEDFEKSTPFTSITNKLLDSPQINTAE
ncbi:putative secreted protein, partial [Cryptosporidium felis]